MSVTTEQTWAKAVIVSLNQAQFRSLESQQTPGSLKRLGNSCIHEAVGVGRGVGGQRNRVETRACSWVFESYLASGRWGWGCYWLRARRPRPQPLKAPVGSRAHSATDAIQ